MDSQIVGHFTSGTDYVPGSIGDLVNNDWVNFSGNATNILAPTLGVQLTGGDRGVDVGTADSDFMNAIELMPFDVVIYDGDDLIDKSAYALFAKNLSNQQGRRCQACIFDYANANDETCISPTQSLTLNTGEVLTAGQTCWWVGGISSGANIFESLTYATHPDVVGVSPALNQDDQIMAVRNGNFVLFEANGEFRIVTDINTFTGFTVDRGKVFRKNRVIRTLFGIANDIYLVLSKYYIGTVNNNDSGRTIIKGEIISYMRRIAGMSAIQNFVPSDITVDPGIDVDAVLVTVQVQPVDSVEKIYMEIVLT
jgi:hypothetical protein